MQSAQNRGEGSREPGTLRSGPVLHPCSARGREAPGFPLVGAWEGPRRGRAGSAWCARRLGQARGLGSSVWAVPAGAGDVHAGPAAVPQGERGQVEAAVPAGGRHHPPDAGQAAGAFPPPPHPHPRLPWGQPWHCMLGLTPSGRVSSALTVHRGQCGARVRDGLAPTAPRGCLLSCSPASLLFALSGRVFSYCLQSSLAVNRHLGFLWLNSAVGGSTRAGLRAGCPAQVQRCPWSQQQGRAKDGHSRHRCQETVPAAGRALGVRCRGCHQQAPVSSSRSASSGASALGGAVPMALGADGSG